MTAVVAFSAAALDHLSELVDIMLVSANRGKKAACLPFLVIFFNALCRYVNSEAVIFTKHTYPVNIGSHLHPYQTRIDITGLSRCAAYCADGNTDGGGSHVCMGFKHERLTMVPTIDRCILLELRTDSSSDMSTWVGVDIYLQDELTCEIKARISPPHQTTGTIAPAIISVQQGDWGVIDMCPNGTYAQGFALKLKAEQGGGDDSALNAVQLICRVPLCMGSCPDSSFIYSTEGIWGFWTDVQTCPNGFVITGARVRSEGPAWDNSAVNSYEFRCQDPHSSAASTNSSVTLSSHPGYWGEWSDWTDCPHGSAICGIKTRVQANQGGGDDTALNDAEFTCCVLSECVLR